MVAGGSRTISDSTSCLTPTKGMLAVSIHLRSICPGSTAQDMWLEQGLTSYRPKQPLMIDERAEEIPCACSHVHIEKYGSFCAPGLLYGRPELILGPGCVNLQAVPKRLMEVLKAFSRYLQPVDSLKYRTYS